ncbi:MAG TPA: hypothetical protein VIN58_04530 [Roseateles sp.]
MKRLAMAITLISSAALLSGCIIVPPRHGGYHHHYGDRYDGGYGRPGWGPR